MDSFEKPAETLRPREHPALQVSRMIDQIAQMQDGATDETRPHMERVLRALNALEVMLERELPKKVN